MGPAQTAGKVDRRGDAKPPNNRDLEDAHLSACEYCCADAAAAKKDEQEGAEEFPDRPGREWAASCRSAQETPGFPSIGNLSPISRMRSGSNWLSGKETMRSSRREI